MRSIALNVFALLLLVACSDQFSADNPLDPANPEYIPPILTVLSGPSVGEVIQYQSVSFVFEGNQSSMLYRTKIDEQYWSGWVTNNSITFDHLDEGLHQFSAQAKYTTGDTTGVSAIEFEVDAIDGPSLRVFPLYSKIYQFGKLNLSIVAEEVDHLVGAEIYCQFDNTIIQIDSVRSGEFFSSNGGNIFIADSIGIGSDNIRIDIGTMGGDEIYLTGTGEMVELFFTVLGIGTTQISLMNNCTIRDENNNVLHLLELHNGLVEIQ